MPVLESRFLDVVAPVVRREALSGDVCGQVESRIEGVPRMIGEARPFGEQFDVQPLVEQEVDVATGKQQFRW